MTLPKSVLIREVGPREGFQTLPAVVPSAQKYQLISALNVTGVQEIEVTSFVRPDLVPQMADAEEVAKNFPRKAGVTYTGLYLNSKGFERAEALGVFQNKAWLYSAVSETFLRKNSNSSLQASLDAVNSWRDIFNQYKKPLHGLMLSTAFGCNYEGEILPKAAIEVLKKYKAKFSSLGLTVQEISLADTMGWANPNKIKQLVNLTRQEFPAAEVSLHLHDTRGTGMANVYAGLEEGVDIFECSVAGLGGCPFAKGAAGNVVSEDVAYMCESLGVSTGLNLKAYVEAAKLAEQIVGHPLPGKLYKVGVS